MSNSSLPDVSVIVCTHERPEDLSSCLAHLLRSAALSKVSTEIVVIDSAPVTRSTKNVVSTMDDVRYVEEGAIGLGAARNTGVRASSGRYLLFTDDDVRVADDWVDQMLEPLHERRCDIVAGAVTIPPPLVRAWHPAPMEIAPQTDAPSHLIGASFGCRRAVFERLSFDESLGAGTEIGSGEDVLFYEMSKLEGFATRGQASAVAYHHFDPRRLRYRALCSAAEAQGRSTGYIYHHLLNSGLRALGPRSALAALRLRFCRQGPLHGDDGIREQEYRLRFSRALKAELRRQRVSEPKYHPNVPTNFGVLASERTTRTDPVRARRSTGGL